MLKMKVLKSVCKLSDQKGIIDAILAPQMVQKMEVV
jgi:hypothetical protein